MNIIKPITKFIKKYELDFILSTKEVKSFHEIIKKDFLLTYVSIVNKEISIEYGLDYIKVLTKDKTYNIKKMLIISMEFL